MSLAAAARVGHQVNHTSALAGFVAGAIIGGAIAVIGIALTIGTAGLAAPAGLALIGLGVGVGSFVGEMIGKHFSPPTPSGPIIKGSPNVFINGIPAAFCSSDVACIKDATQKIAQGSATVGYNQLPAARVGDKGTCGFAVGEGSKNVFVGGGMGGCGLAVGDEVPWWARAIVMAIGLVGGVAGMAQAGICALGIAARLAAGLVVGGLGSMAGSALGGKLFGEGSFGQDVMGFVGGEALSRLAFRGPLGKWMVGEPIDVVTGDVVLQQTDFRLPGSLPLELSRYYTSGLIYDGCHGRKWASSWGQYVTTDSDYAYFHSEDGRRIPFDLPKDSNEVRHQFTNKFRLRKVENGFAVKDEKNQTLLFETKFDKRFLLSAIEDLNKNRIDFIYSDEGALREVRHSGGYVLIVEGTSEMIRRVELLSDEGANEELVRYDYDSLGRLTGIYNQSGLPMRFEYDDEARLTRWEDRLGTWFSYIYNDEGRCIRTRGINGMYSGSLQYNERTLTNSYTDSLGNTTHYSYNGEFQVVKIVDPLGGIVLNEYDDRDNLVSTTDALGCETRFFHDADGNLIKHTDALGNSFSTSFNNFHLPENMTDGIGSVSLREYDERGNVLKIVEPNGNFYQCNRDEKGNVVEILNALNDKCEIAYDNRGLVISATDWKGNKSVLKRNFKGLIREKVDPLGQKTLYEYVAIDRISKVVLPTSATLTWQYDAEGNLLQYTDGNKLVYRYEYGAFDLLIGEFFPNKTRRRYRYNTEAFLISIENELRETYQFFYDEKGQTKSEKDFAGRTLHYDYDLSGNCTKRVNGAGQILTFQPNELGQIIRQINAEGEESLFEYDGNGNVVKATSGDGVEIAFERNETGQIKSESQNGQTVQTAFDILGRLVSRRTLQGNEINWKYDANSLPLEMHLGESEELVFEYDAASRETSRQLKSGLKLQKEYDALNRLTHQWAEFDTSGELKQLLSRLSEQKYSYDESGNPLTVLDKNGETSYEYDLLGQITRVRRNKREIENYQYDATGNVTQASVAIGEVRNAPWQGTREISVGGRINRAGQIEYKYDSDGRVVEKRIVKTTKTERWRFEWSSEGRLRSVVNPRNERWQYRYDAFGRRVEKTSKNGSIKYIWDGAVIVEEISDAGQVKHWTYEENSFRPLAKIENGQVFAVVNDQSGKPLELLNQSGEVAWQQQTNLWSLNVTEQPVRDTDCDIRFQGQWFDEESGLHYNLHRYYDSETARYISNDPIGLDGGMNTYAYVHNPLIWIDPLGLNNVSTGAGRDHVTYRGIAGGKSYTGYASAPSNLGLTPAEIISRRYSGDFSKFGGTAPTSVYSGSGVQGKQIARGLEQHYYKQDVSTLGRNSVANLQNPVGATNPKSGLYEQAKNSYLKGCK